MFKNKTIIMGHPASCRSCGAQRGCPRRPPSGPAHRAAGQPSGQSRQKKEKKRHQEQEAAPPPEARGSTTTGSKRQHHHREQEAAPPGARDARSGGRAVGRAARETGRPLARTTSRPAGRRRRTDREEGKGATGRRPLREASTSRKNTGTEMREPSRALYIYIYIERERDIDIDMYIYIYVYH